MPPRFPACQAAPATDRGAPWLIACPSRPHGSWPRGNAGRRGALLAYLPFADNDTVVEEIVAALTAVGFRDGKADPALLEALTGRTAFGRGAAARALCKAGGNASWKVVRPLLTDSEPAVRLQAALALADANDSQAIAVLIECLADGPASLGAQAEEYLTAGRRLGGPRPAVATSSPASCAASCGPPGGKRPAASCSCGAAIADLDGRGAGPGPCSAP